MGLIIAFVIVAIWAAWVAYTVAKEGKDAYPPYQEPVQEQPKEDISPNWPFPHNKP